MNIADDCVQQSFSQYHHKLEESINATKIMNQLDFSINEAEKRLDESQEKTQLLINDMRCQLLNTLSFTGNGLDYIQDAINKYLNLIDGKSKKSFNNDSTVTPTINSCRQGQSLGFNAWNGSYGKKRNLNENKKKSKFAFIHQNIQVCAN